MILNKDDRTKAAEVATRQKSLLVMNKISTSMTIPTQPSPSIITSRKKSKSDGRDDCYGYNDEKQQYSMGLLAGGRIQMRLIVSLVFALLPGVSLVPLLASSAVAAAPNNEVRMISSSSFSPEQQQQQQQERRSTADAARLLLNDAQRTTNKSQKQSIMKQMALDDQRLAQCEEESLLSSGKNVIDWEQCFFYGTTNGVSSRSPSSSSSSASASASGDDKNKLFIPLPSSSSFGDNAAKISSGEKSKIPTW